MGAGRPRPASRLQPCRGSGERWLEEVPGLRQLGLVVTQSACTHVMRITLSFYITCIYLCVCLQVSCNTESMHMSDVCQRVVCENHIVLLHYIYLFVCVSACCWPACTHGVSMRSEKKNPAGVSSLLLSRGYQASHGSHSGGQVWLVP